MGLVLVTPPTEQPVLLEDLMETIHPVESGEETSLLEGYIAAATMTAETYLRRVLCAQQWTWLLDAFPDRVVRLPKPPLITVDHVKYLDSSGVLTTLAATGYTVDALSDPGRLALAYGMVWPQTRDELNAVQITFTGGWAAAKDIPEGIKTGIMGLIGHWYGRRIGATPADDPIQGLPDDVREAWAPYRMPYFR